MHLPMKTLLIMLASLLMPLAALHAAPRLNILFFTADDMNFDSSGVYGCPIKDLTPHIDQLAAEGLRFQYEIGRASCRARVYI